MFDPKLENLEEGQPCKHPGCLSHVSHPCEGCGRVAGRGKTYVQHLMALGPYGRKRLVEGDWSQFDDGML